LFKTDFNMYIYTQRPCKLPAQNLASLHHEVNNSHSKMPLTPLTCIAPHSTQTYKTRDLHIEPNGNGGSTCSTAKHLVVHPSSTSKVQLHTTLG
jgi:hypothetical protein